MKDLSGPMAMARVAAKRTKWKKLELERKLSQLTKKEKAASSRFLGALKLMSPLRNNPEREKGQREREREREQQQQHRKRTGTDKQRDKALPCRVQETVRVELYL